MRSILTKLDYQYPYAIVKYTNDQMYNNDEAYLYIFATKEEYDEVTKSWDEEQEYTGGTYWVLFKRKDYKSFNFDDE